MSRRRRGFSLIELLIVIAIILIIVTVALPKLNNATRFAHEACQSHTVTLVAVRFFPIRPWRSAKTMVPSRPPPAVKK